MNFSRDASYFNISAPILALDEHFLGSGWRDGGEILWGWVVVLILFVIGVLEIGTLSGVSLQYQNQLKIYTIMKGQLELQFSENEVMINEKTSRRARRASKAAEEARNERDVYLVSLLVAFFIAMFI